MELWKIVDAMEAKAADVEDFVDALSSQHLDDPSAKGGLKCCPPDM